MLTYYHYYYCYYYWNYYYYYYYYDSFRYFEDTLCDMEASHFPPRCSGESFSMLRQ